MRTLLAVAIALAGATTFVGSASAACKPGYHKVTIQGNSVCAHDVAGNNKLAAKQQSSSQAKRPVAGKRATP